VNKSKLLAASSVLAISSVAGTAAFAQGGGDIEQVVVSASRISIAGYQQPTPVSVIGAAALAAAANADIGDTLREMPSMGNSPTPEKGTNGDAANSGALGLSGINLRNLGSNRNLVLIDGQRVVSAIVTGGVDLSIIPSTLVQRVDVVTAGASAAWGSDAVSGVINLIINKSFTGFKASIDTQDNNLDNRRSYGFTATGGYDFDGGRAHVVGAITYNNSPNTVFAGQLPYYNRQCLIGNPAYTAGDKTQPQNLHYNNCGQNTVPGGAVLTGPLAGLGFGAGGAPYKFIPGNNTYYNNAGSFLTGTGDTVGGTPNQSTSAAQIGIMSFPLQQGTAFFYGSYKITPDIQAGLMLNYGYDRTHSSTLTVNNTSTIKTDNAFLDPTIAARMAALGVTSFGVTSNNTDGVDLNHTTNINQFYNGMATAVDTSLRQMYRGVFTLDGALGDDWSWAVSYQHSESHLHAVGTHIEIVQNFANAVDAVRVTTANQGNSGAQVGSIVCRTTLTNPTNGCVPYNVMGTGVRSQASINYVNDNNDYDFANLQQDTAGASMQGKLPWDFTGAGAPSVAFGAEYRKEAEVTVAGPNGTASALGGINYNPSRGEFNVQEGFAEIDVPLIKDGIVQSLSGSLAGRYTSYSISGAVETWKMGLASQVNDDIRLRTTWSYDIRAPNLGELFNNIPAGGGVTDPKTGAFISSALTDIDSNQNLQPEKSTTISGGIVLTPHWVPGLTMSFDWYSINVKGIITSPSQTITLTFCQQGVAFYCNKFDYSAPPNAGNPNGLFRVFNTPQNNGFLTTSGLDFVADYSMDLFKGTLGLHLLGNYTDEETESVFGQKQFDFAGSIGGDSLFIGVPKMKFSLGATYDEGPFSVTVATRYIGTARLNNNWKTGVQVDNNAVPAVAYMDIRGSYKWNDNVQFYAAADNVWDTPPPNVVGTNASTNGGSTVQIATYDTLGRMYHAGVRFSF
jgi:iron complex outermembrane receptor protein